MKMEKTFGANNYEPIPVVIARAEGVWVWDPEGRKYLDCLSAYSAVNQGHRHPRIVNALIDQAGRLTLTSRAFYNDRLPLFLEKLTEITGLEAALPMNTGAEAVETGIKLARKWGYIKKKVERDMAEIIVCDQNFHGRTTTIVGFSSDEGTRNGFGPFTPGFIRIPFDDPEALERAISPNTVAFLVEPIQGEAGVRIPREGFLRRAREICTANNVLLMLDEIQTGLGRTGKMFAFMHEDARPDILLVGKALGGGMIPVSAALSSRDIMDVIKPGDHGSTFGGNPLACAVAMESLDVLVEEKLAERSADLGVYFLEELGNIRTEKVKEIRGKGLFIAIDIKEEYGSARSFCEKLKNLGVLAKDTHGQTIRFAPPLVITREGIDFIVERVKKVL